MTEPMTAKDKKTGDKANPIVDLARWVRSFDKQAIAPAALRQAKLLTLDTIGCGLAGRDEQVSKAVLRTMDITASGPCSIIGSKGKTTAINAVLANGTLVRVLDLNDYVIGGLAGGMQIGGHPSDNIPVALAYGELMKRSGRDVLSAIVIGYEIYGRMRDILVRDESWDGVTISGLAAPAMAGFLMGLDEKRLSHAIALSTARAPTSATMRSGDISGGKSVANALVAQSGVVAASLAEQGVTGPLGILDAKRGLIEVFTNTERLVDLGAPLAERCYIMMANVKAYPCLATGQSVVAAAIELHKTARHELERAQRIDVIMADYKFLRRQQEDLHRRYPESREAADHSFNFLAAVTLLDGKFGLAQFDGERWIDPEVKALMEKMVMVADVGWNARAPGSYPCALRLIDQAGREHLAEVAYPPGFSRDGIDEDAVVEKFHNSAGAALDKAGRDKVVAAVMALDKGGSLTEVFAAI